MRLSDIQAAILERHEVRMELASETWHQPICPDCYHPLTEHQLAYPVTECDVALAAGMVAAHRGN